MEIIGNIRKTTVIFDLKHFRKQNHQINEGEAQPLRIIITSVKDSGDDVLFNVFKRIPGAYIHEFPFMKVFL